MARIRHSAKVYSNTAGASLQEKFDEEIREEARSFMYDFNTVRDMPRAIATGRLNI